MTEGEFRSVLAGRAEAAGLSPTSALVGRLWTYFSLLERWNQKINLAGFSLSPPSAEAIDRLFIEPLAAANWISEPVNFMVDIGSGGGSPAIPFMLQKLPAHAVLIETVAKKGVFLSEALRNLELSSTTEIKIERSERLTQDPGLAAKADFVTVRAVRIDSVQLAAISTFLAPGGRLLAFGAPGGRLTVDSLLSFEAKHALGTPSGGLLSVFRKPA